MTVDPAAVADRLAVLRARIAAAEIAAGRPPGSVRLLLATKTQDPSTVRAAIEADTGSPHPLLVGENRVQELVAKGPLLADLGVTTHLIGPLQSNKVKEAVALFDVIETVDREKIAVALRAEMEKSGKQPRLLVQVNIGLEPQKAGIPPDEAASFVKRCREVHGLTIDGLMAIPPEGVPPGPYFAQMATLAKVVGATVLSMGMSADFETAIAMGATHVRVGSALFGSRTP